ncbi:hypothetical protein CEXT_29941 [Caerostris extrusa]|uniref:Uncharacterized protein n=1 Tax=Caerostris extrusa TaxID=172846 RepID=A0AAV4YAS5_CAEEX|nr:hypothetical protein CEXT_29941 [Caerostris extrusa]
MHCKHSIIFKINDQCYCRKWCPGYILITENHDLVNTSNRKPGWKVERSQTLLIMHRVRNNQHNGHCKHSIIFKINDQCYCRKWCPGYILITENHDIVNTSNRETRLEG